MAVTRRRFLAMSAGVGSLGSLACARLTDASADSSGRLHVRPSRVVAVEPLPPGEHALGLATGRDGLLYVPRVPPTPAAPVPLFVLLHGATGTARGMMSRIGHAIADEFNVAILATDSREGTWDVIRGRFGPDVTFLDAALEHAFARVAIDRTRLIVGGFSDGASYALSLGLVNGDFFTHVMAFSPGFLVADQPVGRPAIYISHGTDDQILPIDRTSRRLVPSLKKAGYPVRYREFPGPHTVPAPIIREAFEWMKGGRTTDDPTEKLL